MADLHIENYLQETALFKVYSGAVTSACKKTDTSIFDKQFGNNDGKLDATEMGQAIQYIQEQNRQNKLENSGSKKKRKIINTKEEKKAFNDIEKNINYDWVGKDGKDYKELRLKQIEENRLDANLSARVILDSLSTDELKEMTQKAEKHLAGKKIIKTEDGENGTKLQTLKDGSKVTFNKNGVKILEESPLPGDDEMGCTHETRIYDPKTKIMTTKILERKPESGFTKAIRNYDPKTGAPHIATDIYAPNPFDYKQSIRIYDKHTGKQVSEKIEYDNGYTAETKYDKNTGKVIREKFTCKYGTINFPTPGNGDFTFFTQLTPKNLRNRVSNEEDDKTNVVRSILNNNKLSKKEKEIIVKCITDKLVKDAKKQGKYTDNITERIKFNLEYKRSITHPDTIENLTQDLKLLSRRVYYDNAKTNSFNGKIDKDIQQGQVGDCWLLSVIKALTNNPRTLKTLNDSITLNKDDSITIELKGVGRKYTISKEELLSSTELCNGDLDVRAIEIAVNSYLHEIHEITDTKENDIDDGGLVPNAITILLGIVSNEYDLQKEADYFLLHLSKHPNSVATCWTCSPTNKVALDEDGNKVNIYNPHAYTVLRSDKEYIYLVNPQDTSTTLKMTHEDFKCTFAGATFM